MIEFPRKFSSLEEHLFKQLFPIPERGVWLHQKKPAPKPAADADR